MNYVINWNLLKHPMNWVTVVMMVVIGVLAWHYLALFIKNQAAAS
jgi:hypothetical protein